MIILILLSIIALITSVVWYLIEPGFEPILEFISGLIGLISYYVIKEKFPRKQKQTQKIKNSSIGMQAGRDIKLGDKNNGKKRKK